MQVLEAYKPFEIQEVSLAEWRQRPVKNNFFEFVLIKEGKGIQCINYNEYEYEEGSMFLLPPLQCHSFRIEEATKFVFLKFTSNFFKSDSVSSSHQQEWFREAAYILSNYNQLPGDIIENVIDRQHIHSLVGLILNENINYTSSSSSLIRSFMISVLEIILRNIKQKSFYSPENSSDNDSRINQILAYINENLANTNLLKVDSLSKTFLISPTYLSEYFKKKMDMSLREYIIKAKLKLVEIRLLNSDYTLSEIADELSFTDASHLSKTFKKYTGMSIRTFKNTGEYQLLKRSTCG